MSGRLRSSLLLGFILTSVLPGKTQSPHSFRGTEASLRITVLVYNMARVPSPILVQAEEEAGRILRETGIEMEWTECPCSDQPGPTDLMLRIIPRLFASMRADFRDDNLGFAPSTEEGGVLATIFFHRVEAVTRGGTVSKVLGNAIAHEFGHLLLGRKAHAPTGIMQPHWTRHMLKLADRGLLHFTPEQGATMRAQVSARTKQKEALQAPMMASLNRGHY